MNQDIYLGAKEFKKKYPKTIAFRLKAHAKVASKFVDNGEKVKYVFVAQKNFKSYEICNTNIVVLTDKRLVVATKRLLFGYFYRVITPDMFKDVYKRQVLLSKIRSLKIPVTIQNELLNDKYQNIYQNISDCLLYTSEQEDT